MEHPCLIVRTDVDGGRLPLTIERQIIAAYPNIRLCGADCANDEQVIAAAQDADVIITNESYINRRVLQALPKLKGIVRYGIGYDRVDIAVAAQLGKVVANVPDFCFEEIGNHVLMFILAWTKKLLPLNNMVHSGQWVTARAQKAPMGSVYGQRLGIVGFGNLGQAVARKAKLLDMQVVVCSRHLSAQEAAAHGVIKVSEQELFQTSDFISINTSLNEKTFHSIGAQQFGLMKPTAVLINTARGPIVDEKALIDALSKGQIAGACLDVCEQEPCIDSPLLHMSNVLITPHVGFYSDASADKLAASVAQEAVRICLGQPVLHPVRPDTVR